MKIFFSISLLIFYTIPSFSQIKETVTVRAGTSLLDYFSSSEIYMYPEFVVGKAIMKTGIFSVRNFNYNFLSGEIQFIEKSDTLEIDNKLDVKYILISKDTFYYDKGYILQIKNGNVKIGKKEYYDFKKSEKKDPYGTTSSGSATTSYNMLSTASNYYKLKVNEDMVFSKSNLYYISTNDNKFILYNKRNVYKLFPQEKEKIKSYIKLNKTKFDKQNDLIKMAEYIETL